MLGLQLPRAGVGQDEPPGQAAVEDHDEQDVERGVPPGTRSGTRTGRAGVAAAAQLPQQCVDQRLQPPRLAAVHGAPGPAPGSGSATRSGRYRGWAVSRTRALCRGCHGRRSDEAVRARSPGTEPLCSGGVGRYRGRGAAPFSCCAACPAAASQSLMFEEVDSTSSRCQAALKRPLPR